MCNTHTHAGTVARTFFEHSDASQLIHDRMDHPRSADPWRCVVLLQLQCGSGWCRVSLVCVCVSWWAWHSRACVRAMCMCERRVRVQLTRVGDALQQGHAWGN